MNHRVTCMLFYIIIDQPELWERCVFLARIRNNDAEGAVWDVSHLHLHLGSRLLVKRLGSPGERHGDWNRHHWTMSLLLMDMCIPRKTGFTLCVLFLLRNFFFFTFNRLLCIMLSCFLVRFSLFLSFQLSKSPLLFLHNKHFHSLQRIILKLKINILERSVNEQTENSNTLLNAKNI